MKIFHQFLHFLLYRPFIIKEQFCIKELPEEVKGQLTCLGKNTEKYITFLVHIGKEV